MVKKDTQHLKLSQTNFHVEKTLGIRDSTLETYLMIFPMSVVIGILLQSNIWYTGVKQYHPRFELGLVTVLVCEFLLLVLMIRL